MKGGPFGDIKNFQKMSHSAEKCKRVGPSGFNNKHSVAKHQKTRRDPFGTLKNFRKQIAQRRKNPKGPLRHVRFCRYP